MCSKQWYLKRNISCDVHLLNELLETDVPWDDAIVVSAGKLRKLWDSLSELHSSVCNRRLERTVLRPALLPVKTAQFIQFFRQVWRHTVKSLSLTESVYKHLRRENSIYLFIYLEISREFLSSNWRYWNSLRALPTVLLSLSLSLVFPSTVDVLVGTRSAGYEILI